MLSFYSLEFSFSIKLFSRQRQWAFLCSQRIWVWRFISLRCLKTWSKLENAQWSSGFSEQDLYRWWPLSKLLGNCVLFWFFATSILKSPSVFLVFKLFIMTGICSLMFEFKSFSHNTLFHFWDSLYAIIILTLWCEKYSYDKLLSEPWKLRASLQTSTTWLSGWKGSFWKTIIIS